jgi:molybdate transport system substrate-binding protein
VLAGGAIAAPMNELAARFEQASDHRLVIRFGTTPELVRLATTGGPFDLGVTPRDVFEDDAAKARFVPGPTIDIARVGLGVAVRAGARKPDIGTPEALTRHCSRRDPSPRSRRARAATPPRGCSSASASARR